MKLYGEYEKQKATILLFPERQDVWRKSCEPIRKMIVDLANIICEYQPVILGVLPRLRTYLEKNYNLKDKVKVMECLYNDCWARDTISSVVSGKDPYIASFEFNAYGGKLYSPWDDDNALDYKVAELFGYKIMKNGITLEGGNMLPDGQGTLFLVKDSVINDDRNPGLTQQEIEDKIKSSTGTKKIIWIKRGLAGDETEGHIDNILAFADSKTLLMSWTDDINNPHYARVREIEKNIRCATNVFGEKYQIVHLPIPGYYFRSENDSDGIISADSSFPRLKGDVVLETYINFVLINGAVIVPQFRIKEDEDAIRVLKEVFKDRDIIPFYSREATLGGGGLHCLSKHIN